MLTARPKGWWSYDYDIFAGATPIAEARRAMFSERGALQVEGVAYSVAREDGPWILRGPAGEELARAEKPSAWRDSFLVQVGGRELRLDRPSMWRKTFVLRQGEQPIGEIRQEAAWNRNAVIELPGELGRPVQVFLTLLTLFLWQREDTAVVAAVS
jgi:hypothetical protein